MKSCRMGKMDGNERKPWHELPGESSEAYGGFCLYLNIGSKRSLNATAQVMGERPLNATAQVMGERPLFMEQLSAWAATFDWARRAELCEQYIDNKLGNRQEFLGKALRTARQFV